MKTKSRPIWVRLPDPLYETVAKCAGERRVSVSWLVREALYEKFEEKDDTRPSSNAD